jgi:hypothetical protein
MLGFLLKLLTVSTLVAAPIMAGIMYGSYCLKKTRKRINRHIEDRRGDIAYLGSLPQDYVQPKLIVKGDKRILKLNNQQTTLEVE